MYCKSSLTLHCSNTTNYKYRLPLSPTQQTSTVIAITLISVYSVTTALINSILHLFINLRFIAALVTSHRMGYDIENSNSSMHKTPGARQPGRLKLVRWSLVFVAPQDAPCYLCGVQNFEVVRRWVYLESFRNLA